MTSDYCVIIRKSAFLARVTILKFFSLTLSLFGKFEQVEKGHLWFFTAMGSHYFNNAMEIFKYKFVFKNIV